MVGKDLKVCRVKSGSEALGSKKKKVPMPEEGN